MSGITTHVLDTAHGRPAAGMGVRLERLSGQGHALEVASGITDADGRLRDLHPDPPAPGTYVLTFATGPWLEAAGAAAFYPEVVVTFRIDDSAQHYHVPLLLSPYGYSTYRGS